MIRFDSVSKAYPGRQRPVLSDLGFEIDRGEFVFLVGASGSGKSSVLRLILREDVASSGEVHVLGNDLRALSARKVPYHRRNLGVVFQDFRLLPRKTVAENVAYALQVLGRSREFIAQAVPDALRTVGLEGLGERFPEELSGGEQQRVAIARAVINKPAILLADEPTGNLDPETSRGIMRLLGRINANGTTVLMATHDVSIVDEQRRRVIELDAGRIVRDERKGVYSPQILPVELDDEPAEVQSAHSSATTINDAIARRVAAADLGASTSDASGRRVRRQRERAVADAAIDAELRDTGGADGDETPSRKGGQR